MSYFIRRGRRRRRRRWVPTCGRGRYNWRTWWCYTCRAGYYQPYNSHRYGYCFSCGPGRYSSSGASYCSACSAGYYCPSYRMSRRYTCPAGRYSSGTYNRACYVSHTENDPIIQPARLDTLRLAIRINEHRSLAEPATTAERDLGPPRSTAALLVGGAVLDILLAE